MKKLVLQLAVAGVVFSFSGASLTADDDHKEKGVPPGLQKKGGVPPGQAKKRGNAQPAPGQAPTPANAPTAPTTVQAKEAPAVVTPAPSPAPAPSAPKPSGEITRVPDSKAPEPARADDRDLPVRQARLQNHVSDLDIMGAKPEVRERLVARLNRQGVPLARLEAQQKAYPSVGIGGITVANLIAKVSKVPADQLLAEHKAGKGWGEIASRHHVYLKDLNEAMAGAKAAASAASR